MNTFNTRYNVLENVETKAIKILVIRFIVVFTFSFSFFLIRKKNNYCLKNCKKKNKKKVFYCIRVNQVGSIPARKEFHNKNKVFANEMLENILI